MAEQESNEMVDPRTLEPVSEAVQEALKPPAAAPKEPLQPCPCGQVPTTLILEVQDRGKYGRTLGNCCGGWSVEFRNGYTADQAETIKRATEAWNGAARGVPADRMVDVVAP